MQPKNFFCARSIILLFLFLATGLASCKERGNSSAFDAKKKQRILFLGNSITYHGKYIKDIEVYYKIHYPERKLEFINVGLPSETVSGLSEKGHADGKFPRPDLHERLARVLGQAEPDLVFANYGMNDGIYLPLDKERFQKFKDGILWLHEQVERSGAKMVHFTPPVYDEVKGGAVGYDDVLDQYSAWLLGQRKTANWKVVDIHGPMQEYLKEMRKEKPDFSLAADGVHPGEEGHWIIAREILRYLGEENVGKLPGIKEAAADFPHVEQMVHAVNERQNIMRDAWLSATGHKRPGINKGLPMEEAKEKAAAIEKKINSWQIIKPKNKMDLF